MGDLERLAGRACSGHASPRDLIAIAEGLKKLPRLKSIIELFKYDLPDWTNQLKNIDEGLLELADTINFKLIENPPLNISEGGIIHDGVDNILDGLRNLMDDYSEWLNKEELKERKISKISNLKIQFGYNKLIIDYQTQKNLEIKNTQRENNYEGSLLWSIDRTYTCMGARCLRRWIDSPLLNVNEIYKRQNIIANFIESKNYVQIPKTYLEPWGI